MDAESVEKEIKEIRLKISEKKRRGQKRLQEYQRLQKELQEGAALIMKWENQVEALQKVLNN
ncbi:hypothetical protein LCGC14_2944120 [marine sediment metagenome]|uniref:Uncharacterized protein n=1 Tax=marine sediment metagenome TaxID=412755 RepID=A0A0F8XHQ8_9ZZZZ